jgi:hypothetical protein
MPSAVIMRYSRGGRQDDVLLGRSQVDPGLADLAKSDPFLALLAGIIAIRGRVFTLHAIDRILRQQSASASLGGPQGDLLPIDTPGTLRDNSTPPLREEPERSEVGEG